MESKENTFLERLKEEKNELQIKLVALSNALQMNGFAAKVGDTQFELLSLQQSTMAAYNRILNMRIQDLESKNGK
jgi:uncharacterized protein (UPF0335 family)